MRVLSLAVVLTGFAGSAFLHAEEPKNAINDLPANSWVPLKPVTVQPAEASEQGTRINAGWNKLVYDPDAKRVLFYDRWVDPKHGGTTIYGNCLFGFDPATAQLTPIVIDGWVKRPTPNGGYRTEPLPDASAPTPCSRHVYHGFDYVPDQKAVYLCNGANQTATLKGDLLGHGLTSDTWRFDLDQKKWRKAHDGPLAFSADGKRLARRWIMGRTSR